MTNTKRYIIGFISGLLISSVSVYAATLINSSDVSFDNSKNGMSSNNVQDAIDELYDMAVSSNPSLAFDGFYVKDGVINTDKLPNGFSNGLSFSASATGQGSFSKSTSSRNLNVINTGKSNAMHISTTYSAYGASYSDPKNAFYISGYVNAWVNVIDSETNEVLSTYKICDNWGQAATTTSLSPWSYPNYTSHEANFMIDLTQLHNKNIRLEFTIKMDSYNIYVANSILTINSILVE